jgi:hypothetical protein
MPTQVAISNGDKLFLYFGTTAATSVISYSVTTILKCLPSERAWRSRLVFSTSDSWAADGPQITFPFILYKFFTQVENMLFYNERIFITHFLLGTKQFVPNITTHFRDDGDSRQREPAA